MKDLWKMLMVADWGRALRDIANRSWKGCCCLNIIKQHSQEKNALFLCEEQYCGYQMMAFFAKWLIVKARKPSAKEKDWIPSIARIGLP